MWPPQPIHTLGSGSEQLIKRFADTKHRGHPEQCVRREPDLLSSQSAGSPVVVGRLPRLPEHQKTVVLAQPPTLGYFEKCPEAGAAQPAVGSLCEAPWLGNVASGRHLRLPVFRCSPGSRQAGPDAHPIPGDGRASRSRCAVTNRARMSRPMRCRSQKLRTSVRDSSPRNRRICPANSSRTRLRETLSARASAVVRLGKGALTPATRTLSTSMGST